MRAAARASLHKRAQRFGGACVEAEADAEAEAGRGARCGLSTRIVVCTAFTRTSKLPRGMRARADWAETDPEPKPVPEPEPIPVPAE
jgi:hypothetical protein